MTVQTQICVLPAHIRPRLQKLGKICPKIYFSPNCFVPELFPRAVPIPSPGQSCHDPECWGSGVWTESCCLVSGFALLHLRCAKWGRCRNLSVLASPDTLDTESWNPNKEDVNQRMPKWLFPFRWRLVSWTGFHLLLSSICFFVSVHTSQQKENISQQW